MRIKATNSLEKLKAMRSKKRSYASFLDVDTDTWTRVLIDPNMNIGHGQMIEWANNNLKKRYSRRLGAYWFEDEKEAFKFNLKFGTKNG